MNGSDVYLPLPVLLPHQCDPFFSDARFKLLICGRRWGKTTLGLLSVLQGSGPRPGALQGGHTWWVAPDYTVARDIWDKLRMTCRPVAARVSEVQRRIELITGGVVEVRSADDPGSLVGVGLDGIVLDEVARISERAWRESLRPTLADTGGWALLIGTPKGHNWVKRLFDDVATRSDWQTWQRPTNDNPLIPQSEFVDMLHDLGPAKYDQEIGAKFTSMEGSMFPAEWFGDSVWVEDAYWPRVEQFTERVCALDAATGRGIERGNVDYSAIVFLGVRDGLFYVDAELMRRPIDEVAARCAQFQAMYNPEVFAFEAVAFQNLLEGPLDHAGAAAGVFMPLVPVSHSGDTSKTTRIQRLTPLLSRCKMRFRRTPGCELLVDQLRTCPVGDHDDGPDALEMANHVRIAMIGAEHQATYEGAAT